MNGPALTTAVLMCHAPIVLPEIARGDAATVRASTSAMQRAAQRVLAARPDVIVVISPHTPRHREAFGIIGGERLAGSFARFGFPEIAFELPSDGAAAGELLKAARAAKFPLRELPPLELDHGALVPLYFLKAGGWRGRTLVVSLPYEPTRDGCERLGEIIRDVAESSGGRWALVASGDMSHRLQPGAPSGYDPRARDFDSFIAGRVREGDYQAALGVDPRLRELAAEDVVDSLAVAAGATRHLSTGHELLSYEGPFGVGYLVAVLYSSEDKEERE